MKTIVFGYTSHEYVNNSEYYSMYSPGTLVYISTGMNKDKEVSGLIVVQNGDFLPFNDETERDYIKEALIYDSFKLNSKSKLVKILML